MKIEKISENQIRCTLTKADLADRQLKLSELAYGTEKAKDLFRDMMQQASYEFGFEAEDIPLMIEAIPLSAECIILIITKVEYPEELDTRFSKFAPSPYEANDGEMDEASDAPQDAAEVLDLFKRLAEDSNDSRSDEAPVKDFIPLPDAINQANTSPDTHFFASNKASKEQSKDKAAKAIVLNKLYDFTAVSYTHLTLPTKA